MACRALLQYTSDNTHPGLRASVRWPLGVASAVPDACETNLLLVGTQPLMNVGGGWVRGSLQIGGSTSSHWATLCAIIYAMFSECRCKALCDEEYVVVPTFGSSVIDSVPTGTKAMVSLC